MCMISPRIYFELSKNKAIVSNSNSYVGENNND